MLSIEQCETLKSGQFQRNSRIMASELMLTDKLTLGSRHFPKPSSSTAGFSTLNLPSGSFIHSPALVDPSMNKTNLSHIGQGQGEVVQSSPRYRALSCPNSCNSIATNGYLKTCSHYQSNASNHSFEHTLKFNHSPLTNTTIDMHMEGDSRQDCQCHELEISHKVCVSNIHNQIQKPLDPHQQTFFQEMNSKKDHEKTVSVQLQLLGSEIHDSEVLNCNTGICTSNSLNVKQAAGYDINEMLSKLTHGKAYYKCGVCELKLFSNEALLAHINTHTDVMPYSCSICGVSFVEGRQLMNHVLHSHSVKAPYACGSCNLTFHENFDLQQHVVSHAADKSITHFDAPLCAKVISQSVDAGEKNDDFDIDKEIEEYNIGNTSSPLDLISMSSNRVVISKNTRFDLRKEPSKIVMDDVNLESVCTVLVEPSTAGGIRKKHLFKCNFCQKVCKDKGSLVSHVRTHTKDRPYECNVCFAKFKQYAHLRDHIMTKHTKDRPYICDRCAKAFNRKSHLQDHMRLKHTDDKLYHCSECPLTFQKRADFSEHKRMHVKALKYQCNICSRQFRNVTDYKRHIRSHTKEKLFECEVCHLTFGLLANAKRHMIKHNKERPFQCDICPKAYHFEHDFKRHKKTHLNKKPFPCSHCYKSFKSSSLLKKHARTIHKKT